MEPWWEGSGLSELNLASYGGDAETVDRLLQDRADPNVADGTGNSPLYWACFKSACSPEYVEVVRLLLAAGARTDACTSEGQPPLFVACWSSVPEVVAALLSAGADPKFAGEARILSRWPRRAGVPGA